MSEEKRGSRAAPQTVEVELLRKYVPNSDTGEVKKGVPPGTILTLPTEEASRAIKLGIATITSRSFE